ncbi:hypothetical protein A3D77_04130 [Candidatus Gottesmanbacteria bacterium RIFCSPHIGHO2_02_FULL_39_11]|uniref:Response regulatory domain-containing protein n=1 Tax=Candidatus Gottesmanbacteria bacterium RIFCSPHIGHO2_02_FULL_39_11 TaxID=1798382 RepID=A0A1F5ZKQ5_9BACT|nr:MAG: hypothetical protein A3D77_04130 [Candidatus Gottesmanbacteria bacterium RIFCSPHIGHO2_02_FULL_39_11]
MTKNIHVIDDDESIQDAFNVLLTTAGYKVRTSSDANYLQKLPKKKLPDLILLDVLLSGSDGREICKKLKSRKVTHHVPIIMVSANMSAGNSFKEYGADDYIEKPFEMDELLDKIKKYTKE